jgi:hypothetical protein
MRYKFDCGCVERVKNLSGKRYHWFMVCHCPKHWTGGKVEAINPFSPSNFSNRKLITKTEASILKMLSS